MDHTATVFFIFSLLPNVYLKYLLQVAEKCVRIVFFRFFNNYGTNHNYFILVNNQLDAHFLMYVYFYSLHVSGNHVLIIRRIIVSMLHLVYVTLCR